MSIDTSKIVTYQRTKYTITGLVVRSGFWLSIACVFLFWPNAEPEDYFGQILGAATFGFFGCVYLVALIHRLLNPRKDVIEIGPNGILDERIAHGRIPWSAVREITTEIYHERHRVLLDIDPAVLRQLGQPGWARLKRGIKALVGARRLYLDHTEFGDELYEFAKTLRAYAKAYDAPAAMNGELPFEEVQEFTTPNTNRTVTYKRVTYTPVKFWIRTAITLAFMVLFVAADVFDFSRTYKFIIYVILIGLLFDYAIALIVLIHRLITGKRDFVEIGPNGIQDDGISKATIPWSAVHGISVQSISERHQILLDIDETQLNQPGAAGIPHRAGTPIETMNRQLDHDSLDVEFDELLPTLRDYARAYDAPAATNGKLP